MTLASATSENHYTGNGATSVYAYGFKIFDDDDLEVIYRDTDDLEVTLTKTTHYTVSGVGAAAGGNVTLVNSAAFTWLTSGSLKNNYKLFIRRKPTLTQTTDIRNQGPFLPETHEDKFDFLTMIDQYIKRQVDRCLRIPDTEDPDDYNLVLPVAADRASTSAGFDADGDVTSGSTFTSGTTASSFMQTVLDDATAAAALTTLGAGINGVTAETAVALDDLILIYDASEGAPNRMTVENLLLMFATVAAKTSAYPVVAADNHKVFTNEGAAGSVAITLPTAVAGYELTFIVNTAQSFVVTANTGDTIRIGGSVSSSAGTATSANVGSALKLTSINATEWIATSHEGTWLLA